MSVRLTESRLRQIIIEEMKMMNQNSARRSGRISESSGRGVPPGRPMSPADEFVDEIRTNEEYFQGGEMEGVMMALQLAATHRLSVEEMKYALGVLEGDEADFKAGYR